MAQSVNQELIQNLRPFISRMVQEMYLTNDGIGDPVTVGDGLDISNQYIWVDLETDSGLEFISEGLAIGLPSNISTITNNFVTGSTHSHRVVTTVNTNIDQSTIIAGDE